MSKAFYKFDGEKCVQIYLDTFDKLSEKDLTDFLDLDVIIDTNSPNPNHPAQPNSLVFKDGVARLKNDDELRDDLIPDADSLRNRITELQIEAGFEWPPIDGVVFRMTAENQRNFTNLDRMAGKGLLTYPYTIWCGEQSVELADASAVEQFYLAGVSFITGILNEGKDIRASFRTMTLAQLKQWIKDNEINI